MERILIDLPEASVEALNFLSSQREQSRASMLREIVAQYLADNPEAADKTPSDFCGAWSNKNQDGLEYQTKIRQEWD